jgi:hypothetical protein
MGQQTQLYPTIPSRWGDSIEAGSRGVVVAVDHERNGDAIYLVEFVLNGLPPEHVWLRAVDLIAV